MERFDAAVIGGGLLGCFAARELSRRKLDIILLEAREDVCTGISRANTAVVYPGYDHKPGTLKAEMTVREIHGQGRISGVTAEHLDSGEQEFIACDTLVTALGLIPERTLVRGLEASPWLSLAGNCCRVYDIVDSAAAQAQRVGHEAGAALNV